MAEFKAHMLERFIGTDEGEVTESQLIQAGYAERVLRVYNMWECNPVATPMDPNVRLSNLDCPEVVDPLLHRKYRSIVGCLSYLVNITRPDLAFSFSQFSKFLRILVMFISQLPTECLPMAKGLSITAGRGMILEREAETSCQAGWIAILPLILILASR
jgi:hypothetical protein